MYRCGIIDGNGQRQGAPLSGSSGAIDDRAKDAYDLIEELLSAGFGADDRFMLAAKRLRMELLQTKGELERELLKWVLDCRRCNRTA